MPIEIEKKYRLTKTQRRSIEKRLRQMSITPGEVEFEENSIYRGGRLDLGGCALRLRRVNGRAILTFKQRFPSKSPIKYQQEEETRVDDAGAVHAILTALGYRLGLVYEKRRVSWSVGKAKLVIDELPFGLFMEIEASEKLITQVEKKVGADKLPAVMDTYPSLTAKFGKNRKGIIEARFASEARPSGRAGLARNRKV
ncbi:MAG: class IV adenylate cyclase [Pyrinomonadaceae bacterium]